MAGKGYLYRYSLLPGVLTSNEYADNLQPSNIKKKLKSSDLSGFHFLAEAPGFGEIALNNAIK
ncbi:MAG TPA: hypothetical protein VNW95_02695 [Mucilaginibacter sp.]|jgi:hypothetical protein|nr:hypothetical protein [Mucilaginibacter sp.]